MRHNNSHWDPILPSRVLYLLHRLSYFIVVSQTTELYSSIIAWVHSRYIGNTPGFQPDTQTSKKVIKTHTNGSKISGRFLGGGHRGNGSSRRGRERRGGLQPDNHYQNSEYHYQSSESNKQSTLTSVTLYPQKSSFRSQRKDSHNQNNTWQQPLQSPTWTSDSGDRWLLLATTETLWSRRSGSNSKWTGLETDKLCFDNTQREWNCPIKRWNSK